MEKYQRLTKEKSTSENTKLVYNGNGFVIFEKSLIETLLEEHNRLWELENQIESNKVFVFPCNLKNYKRITKRKSYYDKDDHELDLVIELDERHYEQVQDIDTVCEKLNRLVQLENEIENFSQFFELRKEN